ncbi:type II secretion system protein N [Pseudomonas citronellolis]|uniref:type II secretion system protein N n=1 Tax=Pseudomonas citronellolis TaxID=53408 RepID=UPI0009EEE64F|nr:type II secretion system protein N [Pseudomonas citronellolis]
MKIDIALSKLAVPSMICGLCAVAAFYVFSFLKWQRQLDEATVPQSPGGEVARQKPTPNREVLAQLFGSPAPKAETVPVKESNLSLKLVASYAGSEESRSAAVIEGNENAQALYYPGDKLLPGVELISVQSRRVLIRRNGVLESVSLDERKQDVEELSKPIVSVAPKVSSPTLEPLNSGRLSEKLSRLKSLAAGDD